MVAGLLLMLPVFFSSCVKDHCKREHPYSYFVPVYKTKDEVRNNIKSNSPKPIQQPGKIYIFGNTIFLNEVDKGIHVIDNSNPSNPRNIAFIDIPGNLDIAVKGNTLYADMYTDLVAMDISNPASVQVKKIIEDRFPYRYYSNGFVPNHEKIITEWVRKDTVITESCSNPADISVVFDLANVFLASAGSQSVASAASSSSPAGVGGSMARFTIMNNRLYTVGDSYLDVYNISNSNDPLHTKQVLLAGGIETIYPFKDKLFIGSQSGMYMYDVTNADVPAPIGQFVHVRSCDPVIADDNFAYVTLRSGSMCQGFNNELDIVNISNINYPSLAKVYPLTNPRGLSKSGNFLFICDGAQGVKVYNAADVMNLQLVNTIPSQEALDVITYNNIALVTAKDGLYQYNYSNPANIHLLSKIAVAKK